MGTLISQEKYRVLMDEHVRPALVGLGFSARGKDVLCKWDEDCLWRIGNTTRKVRSVDHMTFAVFLCVGFRSLALFLEDFKGLALVNPRMPCAMATDLGHLFPPFRYHEWKVWPNSDASALASEILSKLEEPGLPYLERYGDLDRSIEAWEAGVTYNLGEAVDFYLPAAYWVKGDREKAMRHAEKRMEEIEGLCQTKGRQQDFMSRTEQKKFLEFLTEKLNTTASVLRPRLSGRRFSHSRWVKSQPVTTPAVRRNCLPAMALRRVSGVRTSIRQAG